MENLILAEEKTAKSLTNFKNFWEIFFMKIILKSKTF